MPSAGSRKCNSQPDAARFYDVGVVPVK